MVAGGRTSPGRERLSTVAALIGKAQGSPFVAEQESLVMKAYTELAAILNSAEINPASAQEPRRRERRLLVDRRAQEGQAPGGEMGIGPARMGRAGSRRRGTDSGPEVIDLRVGQARAVYRTATPGRTIGTVVDFSL
jgi:hypothetical protein